MAQTRQPLPELTPTASGDALYRALGYAAQAVYCGAMSVSIEGKEKLPKNQGFIVVANHISEVDPITVAYPMFVNGTLPRFLAKESLFRAPVLGFILRKLAHIPVSRGSVDARKSLETAQNVIEAGGAVVIYPEGTLTKDPDLWPMQGRTGAARLALSTGAPVYPVAHWGDHEFMPPKSMPRFFPRKKVKIKVGDQLEMGHLLNSDPGHKYSRAELAAVTDYLMDSVTSLLEEIRGEAAPKGRYNPATGQRETKPVAE